jgi:hypothetical protein
VPAGGGNYDINFWLYLQGTDDAYVTVSLGGVALVTEDLAAFQVPWTEYSIPVSGSGTPQTLDFQIDTSASPLVALDNISICVAPVPEPTTMIAGALLLLPFGWGAFRQCRKKLQTV